MTDDIKRAKDLATSVLTDEHLYSTESTALANALLAVLPVVEAAQAWRDKPCECGKEWPGDELPENWECPNAKAEEVLSDAVDALRDGAK